MANTPLIWPERGRLDQRTAQKLRAAREAAGLSLRQAARRTGISYGFLCQLEHGVRRPRAVTAEALIRAVPMEPGLVAELRAASDGVGLLGAPRQAARLAPYASTVKVDRYRSYVAARGTDPYSSRRD